MPTRKPLLGPERAIKLLRRQLGKDLEKLPFDDPQLHRWWNTTTNIIREAFGANHPNAFEFNSNSPSHSPHQLEEDHAENIRKSKALIEGFIEQLELFRLTEPSAGASIEASVGSDTQQAVAEHAARRQAVVWPILAKKRWKPGRLATQAGVSKNSVYGYLDGTRSKITDANRKAIADALGIEPHQLPD
jgi:hypothetical protein